MKKDNNKYCNTPCIVLVNKNSDHTGKCVKNSRTFQGFLKKKKIPSVFKDYMFMKNTDLHIKILPPKIRKLVLEIKYSKTCIKRPLSKRPKVGFQDQLLLNAGHSISECSLGAFCNTFDLHYATISH